MSSRNSDILLFSVKSNAFWRVASYINIFVNTFFCRNYIILNDIFTFVIFEIRRLPFFFPNGRMTIVCVCLNYLAGLIIFLYYIFLEKSYFKQSKLDDSNSTN